MYRKVRVLVLERKNDILNKYSIFKEQVEAMKAQGAKSEGECLDRLKKKYVTDDKLLKKYLLTYKKGF